MVNNGAPSMVLKMSGLPMSPTSKTALREQVDSLTTGSNQRRLVVLDPDQVLEPMGFNHADLELLAQKKWTTQEIAAAYMIPTYMLGDSEKLSRSNATELSLTFIQNTLLPITRQLEVELKRKLIPANSPAHIAFDLRERLRGDFSSQLEAFSVGAQNGFYTRNQILRQLGEDPIDGPEGDLLTVQVNMTNLANMLPGVTPPEEQNGPDDTSPSKLTDPTDATRYFLPMVADAVRRTLAGETATRALGAVTESIASLIAANVGVEPGTQRMIDFLNRLESRATTWDEAHVDNIAAEFLKSATRAFTFGFHEDAAAKAVLDGAR
jgi:hypothetical protein